VAINKKPFNKNISESTQAFQELAKRQDEQSQLIVKWIASNKDMWDSMSETQKLQLIATETLNKDLNKGVEKWNNLVDLAKEYNKSTVASSEHILAQVDHSTAMGKLAKGLVGREQEYNKLLQGGTKFHKAKAAIMVNTVDRTREVAGNMLSIGTSEFISLDLNRDIAKAKAHGNKEDVKHLKNLQTQQDEMKRVHNRIDETAKLINQPFSAIDDWIKQIPIFGGLISSLMPFDEWGEQLSDAFREGASESAREEFTGKTDESRQASLEYRSGLKGADSAVLEEYIQSMVKEGKGYIDDMTNQFVYAEGELSNAVQNAESVGNKQEAQIFREMNQGGPIDSTVTSEDLTISGDVVMYVNGSVTTTGGVIESATGGTDMVGDNMMNFDEWNKSVGNATVAAQQSVHAHKGYNEYMEGFAQPNIATEALPMGTMEENIAKLTAAGTTPGSIHTHVGNFDELITKAKALIPAIISAMKGKGGGGGGGAPSFKGEGIGGQDLSNQAEMGESAYDESIARAKSVASQKDLGKEIPKTAKSSGKFSGFLSKAKGSMGKMIGIAGVLGGVFYKLWSTARDLGVAWNEMPISALIFKDEAQAVLDEFGSLSDVSNEVLWTMKKTSVLHGVQATDMAKILKLQVATTDSTKEMALDQQVKWIKQIKKEGLSASKVFADMAGNMEFVAAYTKGTGDNIIEATKHAAKLGSNLGVTAQMAESLLDWETSIAKEMELSVLLNKNLNFERARQLIYDGKLVQGQKEVLKQLGGEAEWNKMTAVQRQEAASALSIQTSDLMTLMMTEEQKAKALADQNKQYKLQGAIVFGIIGAIAGALIASGFGAGIGLAMLGGMTAGAIAGGALGYSTFGSGVFKDMKGAGDVIGESGKTTKIATKEGQFRELSPNDDWAAAPNLLETMASLRNQQPIVVQADNTGTEQKLEQLIALTNQSLTDREEQARKQRNATLDIVKGK
jgi:hypothetical protein